METGAGDGHGGGDGGDVMVGDWGRGCGWRDGGLMVLDRSHGTEDHRLEADRNLDIA